MNCSNHLSMFDEDYPSIEFSPYLDNDNLSTEPLSIDLTANDDLMDKIIDNYYSSLTDDADDELKTTEKSIFDYYMIDDNTNDDEMKTDLKPDDSTDLLTNVLNRCEIKDKLDKMEKMYEKMNLKLKRFLNDSLQQCHQFQAMNRIVQQMEHHQSKLIKLPGQNKIDCKIECYKTISSSSTYYLNAEKVQNLLDQIYSPYQQFRMIKNQSIDTISNLDEFCSKINSNLSQLIVIRSHYKDFKPNIIGELDHCHIVIDEMRSLLVRNVIDIIQELHAEDFDSSSLIRSHCQISLVNSFKKLLSTIA